MDAGTTYRDEPQQAFAEAIASGRLTERTAADYMYMYTQDGVDAFKHRDTREYLRAACSDLSAIMQYQEMTGCTEAEAVYALTHRPTAPRQPAGGRR